MFRADSDEHLSSRHGFITERDAALDPRGYLVRGAAREGSLLPRAASLLRVQSGLVSCLAAARGRLRFIATIEDPIVVERIRRRLGLPSATAEPGPVDQHYLGCGRCRSNRTSNVVDTVYLVLSVGCRPRGAGRRRVGRRGTDRARHERPQPIGTYSAGALRAAVNPRVRGS
jgi:hypothetical protein